MELDKLVCTVAKKDDLEIKEVLPVDDEGIVLSYL